MADRPEGRTARAPWGRAVVGAPTAAEAAAADQAAREAGGVPERVLMENAGRAAALVLDRLWPRGRVVAAVGGGNNGGDALVLLRTLRAWGRDVGWVRASGQGQHAALLHGFELPPAEPDARAAFAGADVLVDGVLGTGARGAPRGEAAPVVAALEASGRPVLALDLPSGVDPTTGEVAGVAVRAAATVCFGWPKRGLLFPPGRERCGRLLAVEIGFPPRSEPFEAEVITGAWARARLPERRYGAHKGSVGRVLVCAGRPGMGGAAAIAGHAAVRAGAGLVHLVSPEANRVLLQARVPEALFTASDDGPAVDAAAEAADALVVGPGLGTGDAEAALLARLLAAAPGTPLLLDADALTLLAARGQLGEAARGRRTLLTPHPGELARITKSTTDEVRADPVAAAMGLARESGAVVLLKGAPSLVAAAGESVLLDPGGSSDLATAGMGDHLAGVAGALLAAGAAPRDAGALALWYGGRAAALAARGRSLSPVDVSDQLGAAFAEPQPAASSLGLPFIVFDQPARW